MSETRNPHPEKVCSVSRPVRISRRGFGRAALGAAPALVASGCADDANDARTRVGTLDELEGGEPIEFDMPGAGPCFAVALGQPAHHGVGPEERIVAFSSVCPHMGCIIATSQVDPESGRFGPCSCHRSLFDIRNDGRLVHGRAASNLPRIELRVEGETVYAVRPTRLAFGQPLTTMDDVSRASAEEGGA